VKFCRFQWTKWCRRDEDLPVEPHDPKALRHELVREKARLARIDAERERALRRLAELQAASDLAEQRQSPPADPAPTVKVQGESIPRTTADKIQLFRSLFRGRPDVYPRRWVNENTGKQGYSPACANEWVHGVCDKRRVKCGECPNQAFIPVSDRTILDHLRGIHVVGVYPMLADETCWFLAIDFDKGPWQEDVAALLETCRKSNVPAAVERSRSGNGAHVWFFFRAPVAAVAARKMGCYLITQTMGQRHELPMSSYDRLFPNQDTVPRGGFGNLIALPFQDGPRQQGNTVFVGADWLPLDDQWSSLAEIRRMTPAEVEGLAREATQKGRVVAVRLGAPDDDDLAATPWARPPLPGPSMRQPTRSAPAGPLPARIRVVLAQLLFVEKAGLPSPAISEIKQLAAFQNPEFYKKQAMRLSTALTPRVIDCAEDGPQYVGLPRGCLDELKGLLAGWGVALDVEDQRTEGQRIVVHFHGSLTAAQDEAVQALAAHDIGIFVAPPGSGKTVVGTELVARRGRSTLVLVHRTQLLEQWVAQLALFLDLPSAEIGRIGGGKRAPNGRLDVAMIQSLVHRGNVDDIVSGYGHVIVDECHHVPAVSFECVMREVKARYIAGLTATPYRRDGHHPILELQLGPERYVIHPKSQAAERSFEHRLLVRYTEFRMDGDETGLGIQEIYRQLASDQPRNDLILDDVIAALEEGRSPILLTERRNHLEYLAGKLRGTARNLVVLRGGMKSSERRTALAQLASIPDNEERLLLATGRFIGEGFDDARLDTLFLVLPVSWKGTLVQYAGRLHRSHHTKREVRIVDYVDRNVPMCARMFTRRMRGYRAMGYGEGEMSRHL
jgi:superfamily II DNA or RNA helicase